jgi:hypothetical protein
MKNREATPCFTRGASNTCGLESDQALIKGLRLLEMLQLARTRMGYTLTVQPSQVSCLEVDAMPYPVLSRPGKETFRRRALRLLKG